MSRLVGNITSTEIIHCMNAYVALELSLRAAALAALQQPVCVAIAERITGMEPKEPNRRASVDCTNKDSENSALSNIRSRRFSTSVIPTRTPFYTRGRRPSVSVSSNFCCFHINKFSNKHNNIFSIQNM